MKNIPNSSVKILVVLFFLSVSLSSCFQTHRLYADNTLKGTDKKKGILLPYFKVYHREKLFSNKTFIDTTLSIKASNTIKVAIQKRLTPIFGEVLPVDLSPQEYSDVVQEIAKERNGAQDWEKFRFSNQASEALKKTGKERLLLFVGRNGFPSTLSKEDRAKMNMDLMRLGSALLADAFNMGLLGDVILFTPTEKSLGMTTLNLYVIEVNNASVSLHVSYRNTRLRVVNESMLKNGVKRLCRKYIHLL